MGLHMKPHFFIFFLLFSCLSIAQKKLVILGDSISEGYGVSKENSYPSLLENKISQSGKKWTVINASISGSTSASGPSRIKWQLKNKPDLILIALGANDGLRGLPVPAMKKNLAETIELAQKEKIKVVIAGIMMPPNYGKSFTAEFKKVFPDLAKQYKIKLIPFLLDKVAGNPDLNQTDGIHPNEKGHRIVFETVYRFLKEDL
jgi:acyl-CoA thioesterase-1